MSSAMVLALCSSILLVAALASCWMIWTNIRDSDTETGMLHPPFVSPLQEDRLTLICFYLLLFVLATAGAMILGLSSIWHLSH